jgi:hypothetical protein
MKPKRAGQKGLETEELLRAYFLKANFFVLRGVQLRHEACDLTDLDLWVYERSATLARRRTIIDIKDKGKPQAAERLFFIKGVAEVIGVEAAGVATTDDRPALRDLARKNGLLWLDGADLQRLKASEELSGLNRLSEEELAERVAAVDAGRASRAFRDALDQTKSAVADRFGAASANVALDGALFFSHEAVSAHPGSPAAQAATRLTYLSVALAAAALDFASADTALRPQAERLRGMTDAIRYGADMEVSRQRLRMAEAMIREYAPNGAGLAQVVKDKVAAALNAIPAEGLAEIVVKLSRTSLLFQVARSLEQAAYDRTLRSFDNLDSDTKVLLGAVLDFVDTDRKLFAQAWENLPGEIAEAPSNATVSAAEPQDGGSKATTAGPILNLI